MSAAEDKANDSTGSDPGKPPARLGRYEILHRIGSGGMAEVYFARQVGARGLDRWVAVKRIHPHLARHQPFVHMLVDEARLAARIAHPNVAQVLDLGEDDADGTPFLVLEYLRGQPLSVVLRRARQRGGADLALMARVVAHACEGAHAAHELRGADGVPVGLVHRDLSPQNLFVTYDGAVKVVDFGVAKAAGRSVRTQPGTLKGKFSYMSPEQVRDRSLDRRSDIYALGLVLYEATTGLRVYDARTDAEVIALIDRGDVEPPSSRRVGYPLALEGIVMRALERAREERFGTARELGDALDAFLAEQRARTGPARIAAMMEELFGAGANAAARAFLPAPTPWTPPSRRPRPPDDRAAGSRPQRASATWLLGEHFTGRRRSFGIAAGSLLTLLGAGIAYLSSDATGRDVVARAAPRTHAAPERNQARGAPERTETVSVSAPTGTLTVRAVPRAMVFVDGRRLHTTPVDDLVLPAGTHGVRLVTADQRERRLRVHVAPGAARVVDVKFRDRNIRDGKRPRVAAQR